ncbi:Glycoside hydrolase family 61 protein [Ceratobasidium theobromae]|uniref:lytic cellulose monooxygenase (C4-dehydrogenating) n=1 Tax=Ceratobasidium theobromae TaxID=1582974 RepID=A0A5N5QRJ9_9AGAM|nr:Glycoside hydrolase family 61 protein [Ceratobasidium theobromae]
MLFSSLVSVFALAAVANAHGYVDKIIVDGKTYNGPIPGETNPKSPIRRISTINPYKDPKGSGITCGEGSQLAAVVAPATAGSKLDLTWVAHPNQKWPHEMGPLITYMAKVPAGQTADKFDASKGDFFKIAQEGQDGDGWFVARLMKLGTKYTVTIPKELEDGDYIMRHEIIALHLADSKGGAEFYSSCFQLRVTGGTGSAKTTASETVRFPGGYTANDKGIFTPKVFDNGFKYTFPGPAIATFANTGNSTEPEPSSTASQSAEPSATPEPDDDDCNDEEPTASATASAAPEPTGTDDCNDEDPDSNEDPEPSSASSTKAAKPTSKSHKDRRARSWMSRTERRFIARHS